MQNEIEKEVGIFQNFINQVKGNAVAFGIKLIIAALIIVVGIRIIKWIRGIVRRSLQKSSVDDDKMRVFDKTIKAVLDVLLVLIVAGYLGLQASSILAIVASTGLTIGLAFQGVLSNFAGGVLILGARLFRIGDYILVPEKNIEGTVTEIGIIHTKITTNDLKLVTLPNGDLSGKNIVNASTLKKRHMELMFDVHYRTDIDFARRVIIDAVKAEEHVLKGEEVDVHVASLEDSSVKLIVRCFVNAADARVAVWNINELVKKALDANGIEIPYAQIDVHMDKK